MALPALLLGLVSRLGIATAGEGVAAATAARGASSAAGSAGNVGKALNAASKTPKGIPEGAPSVPQVGKQGGSGVPDIVKDLAGGNPQTQKQGETKGQKSGNPNSLPDKISDALNGGNPQTQKQGETKGQKSGNPNSLPDKISDALNGGKTPTNPFDNQFINSGGSGGNGGGGKGGSGGPMPVMIVSPMPVPVRIVDGVSGPSKGKPSGSGGSGLPTIPGMSSKMNVATMAVEAGMEAATTGLQRGTQAVNNDFRGMFDSLSIVPEPVKKLVDAFDDAAKAIMNRSRELNGLNGSITQANVNRDVSLLKADIREAQGNGENYARVTNSYTELEVSLRDMFNPIKDALANVVASVLEIVNFARELTTIQETLAMIGIYVNLLTDLYSGNIDKFFEHIEQIPEKIGNAIFRNSKKSDQQSSMDILANTFNAMMDKRNPNKPNQLDANQPLGIDIING